MALVPVILSGGAGTRLWPLSRESAPKPFMILPDGETLLAKTVMRAVALPNVAALITVTNRDYYFHTKDVYAGAGVPPPPVAYLLEPFGRNTAAAVALAAMYAESTIGADSMLLVLPADHLIRDTTAFALAVERAASLARDGWLATFGIVPGHAETGYGYIQFGEPLDIENTYRVDRFIEKPPLAEASHYVASGRHAWNSGMFCFTPAAILEAFASHAPAVLDSVRRVWQSVKIEQGSPMMELDAALFAAVPDISIDYAVMEKAANVAVVRGAFDWSDVGSWQAVSALAEPDADGNRGQGTRVTIASRDTFIHAEDRVVATVGVDNLIIVDTPDAVLVAHRDHLQRVREVVSELKARGHDAYKLHRTVARPWGAFTVLQEGPGFKIKRIEVKPGGKLSLQMHAHRSEHWVVVSGEARVTNGERVYPVQVNESTFIPLQTRHRLENVGAEPLVMIEVQCGDYVGEDDIVRFDDQYGRVKA
ncbi:MAG: mannose-1-phosphate guanylyltransferase/mannose-6-phosphate isomerase [Pseudomonadota bacterium]|nr:mannose-1-phosphate guanylyltransferase/mannose-6-phosphate isomerase [Pseudomonadota bacterium]